MNSNEEKRKKVIIVSIILLLILLVSILIIAIQVINHQKEENTTLEYSNLKTVKDVVKFYKCKYISEEISIDSNYDWDVYLEFCKLLYEEEKSNEAFYNDIIKDIARVLNYKDFRLLDQKNEITIEVICENYKVDNIIINGIEDYFIYMDSQLSLRKYKEIKITEFSAESPVLIEAVNSSWNKDINFGTRESLYNRYNVYFDEGIKVRNIDSRIYNIIFTSKYKGTVINGITPGTSFYNIKQILGEPAFEDEELEFIGYKGNDYYVFFTLEEISVYRLEKSDMNSFFDLVKKFLNDEVDFLEMMNELTYMWPDYSDYNYTANQVFISYPQKGVDIKINYEDTTGIIIYNNFNYDIEKVKPYFENTEFMGLLQVDNVFQAEKRRIKDNKLEKEELKEYKDKNITGGYASIIYDCYPIYQGEYITQLKFISKDNNRPNRELNDTLNSFLWINDLYFVFSKKGKGIYLYDLNTGFVSEILIGEEDYVLKEYINGVLKFDDQELLLQF